MMAPLLPVMESKKNKQTEKNMFFIAVFHKFTSILKKHEKPHHNDCLNLPGLGFGNMVKYAISFSMSAATKKGSA